MDSIQRLRFRSRGSSAAVRSRSQILTDYEDDKKYSEVLLDKYLFMFLGAFYTFILFIIILCEGYLPSPRSIDDVAGTTSSRSKQYKLFTGNEDNSQFSQDYLTNRFSEERARNILNELVSIGPRPTGSYENEVLAFDFIKRQLEFIKSQAENVHAFDIEVQKPTGSFFLKFGDGFTSYYRNVKNVIARIGPRNYTGKSLLVNCHFDTVPTSPGASDDSVNCATMLEILMVLSNQNRSLPHNIVFLFNGAEENILQASHGFITQHRWAKEIKAFINLESCGAGGRDMLFQAGPEHPWIVQAYTEGAKFPFGSIVAQEVFQSGVVPSDTDFRIFTEFGGIPGLDFAYVRNGYVYHTKYDRPEFINEGSIQRTGENMLGLIHNILKSPHFNHPLEYRSSKLVFFDVLGLFMITYSASLGTIMNESIAILTVLEIFLKIRLRMDKIYTTVSQEASRLLIAISITLSSAVLALCVNLTIAAVLGAVGYSMTWYNRPYWILGVYFFPALSCLILVHWFVTLQRRQAKGSDWEAEDLYYDAVRVIWAVIICLMTRFDIHSAYLPTVLLLFTTAIRSLGGRLCISTKTKGARLKLIIIHLSSQAIPLVIILYNCWQVFLVFVPIMGRTGAQVNPDLIIGAVTAIIAYICTSYMLTLVHVARYVLQAVGVLFLLFITCLCIVCLSPLGFPYSEDTNSPAPQKYIIAHVERNFHRKSGELQLSDGGFWIVPLDHNGPYSLFPFVPELQNAELVECVSHPYCGMPYYLPFVSKLKKSYYLKGSKPKIHTPFKLELVEMKTLNPELRKLKFRVTGPTHMAIILCPVEKVILLRWSLTYSLPHPGVVTWNKRPVYFIYYSDGEATTPWEFWVDLEVPSDFTSDQPIVDLTFNTHYLHGSDMIGEDLQELLEKMPPWTHVTAWTSTLQSFIF